MTEIHESNTILEVTYDEGAVHLITNLKYTLILAEPLSPTQNTPHSTILILCVKSVSDYHYKTEAATYHYL